MIEALASFHFLRPWWLLTGLPPLLLAVLSLRGRKADEQWQQAIAPHLLAHLITSRAGRRWFSPAVVLVPVGLLVAVAMAGPAYRLADNPQGPDDTTLIVVVDLSRSMTAPDIGPSRIGRLRLKLRDLFDVQRGGRIGLVAVAGTAHVVMPPTDDVDALVPYVDVLDPELMPEDGEAFDVGAARVLELAKAEKGPTVVLVAADAIPPDGADALANLSRRGITLIGWTVGTDAGRPTEGAPGLDRAGFDRLSRAGAEVVDLSLGGGDLRRIHALLERARTASADARDASLWQDDGYALVPLIALVVLTWFRRGWVVGRSSAALALLIFVGGCSQGGEGSWWLDLWLTPDQQGRRLFEAGEYAAAAQRFADPMWKGIAFYTAHDWKAAQAQFARIDTLEGRFNLADAHAQAREIASAIAVYDEVLREQPTHRGARLNRDYFQHVLEGLEQTTDFDELKKPDQAEAADPTQAALRPDQLDGPEDKAAKAAQEKQTMEKALSGTDGDAWMKRVSTTPADFLRNKFAMQAAASSEGTH